MKIEDLNEKQIQFIQRNAIRLFTATMLQPNDDPNNILMSTCNCCNERRIFLREVLSMKG